MIAIATIGVGTVVIVTRKIRRGGIATSATTSSSMTGVGSRAGFRTGIRVGSTTGSCSSNTTAVTPMRTTRRTQRTSSCASTPAATDGYRTMITPKVHLTLPEHFDEDERDEERHCALNRYGKSFSNSPARTTLPPSLAPARLP